MKKLIFICEGQTEEMFCDRILKPHFALKGIDIEYPLILHSGGGIVPWRYLKNQIELHHRADNAAFVTTLIDYYGMKPTFNYPGWVAAHLAPDKTTTMNLLEAGMQADLPPAASAQFIPYIQLHEFEALVLSDVTAFGNHYEVGEYDAAQIAMLCALDPETVNDGPTTAPSKRLENAIPGYNKVDDGFELTNLAGLTIIRNRCPRFNAWIAQLEGI